MERHDLRYDEGLTIGSDFDFGLDAYPIVESTQHERLSVQGLLPVGNLDAVDGDSPGLEVHAVQAERLPLGRIRVAPNRQLGSNDGPLGRQIE